jgi:hypothetical protein
MLGLTWARRRRVELHAHRVTRLQQQQRMAGEAADIDHVGGAHGERRRARGQDLVGHQRVAREAWMDTLIVPDAEVHIAAFQQSYLRRAQRLGQLDLHVRKSRNVSRQECR